MSKRSFKQERDITRFDDWATTYEDSPIQRIRNDVHQGLIDWIAVQRISPGKILDIGCGTGALLRGVHQKFDTAELTGVDIAPNMIEAARAYAPANAPVMFVEGAAENLPFEDEQFDLVVTTICFHHWRSRVEGLAEIRRVLKPGGRLCVVDHFAIGWLRPFFWITRCRDRVHTPVELDRMHSDAGLRVLDWVLIRRLAGLPFIHGVCSEKPR